MPTEAIQGTWVRNWNSGALREGSNPAQRKSEAPKVRSETQSASTLCCRASSRGTSTASSVPARGRKMTTFRRVGIG